MLPDKPNTYTVKHVVGKNSCGAGLGLISISAVPAGLR